MAEVPESNKGVARIKPEFLLQPTSKSEEKEPTASQEAPLAKVARGGDDSGDAPAASKVLKSDRRRGQNTHRRNKQTASGRDFSSRLCPSIIAANNECRFGEKCKFTHDLAAFMAAKPPDLAQKCPIFDLRGFCHFGAACRFGRAHTDADTFANRTDDQKWSDWKSDEVSGFSAELQTKLRKRTYNFAACDVFLKQQSDEGEPSIGSVVDDGAEKRTWRRTGADFCGKLYLAPLTTVGNLPFRRICTELGAEITCGEMALATSLLQGNQSEWSLLRKHESEKFFGVQICGGYPDMMMKCTQLIADNCDMVDFVDVNLGCPIDVVCQRGGGAALADRSTKLRRVLAAMSTVLTPRGIPLTIKVRTGVKADRPTAHMMLPRLFAAEDGGPTGVQLVTMHGRSKEQRYTKLAKWDYVNECAAKIAADVPMVGCGDVLSYEDYYNNLQQYPNIKGIMIGRGALIKPWIFTEIKERRHWDISSAERWEMLKKFVNYGLVIWGSDQQGVETTRKFLLEWLSFLHRYIPVGVLEHVPQRMNEKPPRFVGRDDLETLLASDRALDWVLISERLLGPTPDGFLFVPKHKASAY